MGGWVGEGDDLCARSTLAGVQGIGMGLSLLSFLFLFFFFFSSLSRSFEIFLQTGASLSLSLSFCDISFSQVKCQVFQFVLSFVSSILFFFFFFYFSLSSSLSRQEDAAPGDASCSRCERVLWSKKL